MTFRVPIREFGHFDHFDTIRTDFPPQKVSSGDWRSSQVEELQCAGPNKRDATEVSATNTGPGTPDPMGTEAVQEGF